MNYSTFANRAASEKVTLATVEAKQRLYVFEAATAPIYTKSVPHFVVGVKQNGTSLALSDSADLTAGQFFYDPVTGVLSVRLTGNVNPNTVELITTYRFHFSSKSVSLPAPDTAGGISDIGDDVFWEGRIQSSPGYKHKIGIDQALSSLVGEGKLQLQNNDGGLDDIYDRLIFENQKAVVYSWSPEIDPSQAKVIYRGRITNKSYSDSSISLTIKDQTFSLLGSPPLQTYDNNLEVGGIQVNVADSVQGQIVRAVYGKVEGLRCQSAQMIGDGIILNRTASMPNDSNLVTFSSTTFSPASGVSLDPQKWLLQDDVIIVGAQEFVVEDVNFSGGNLVVTTKETSEIGFTAREVLIKPARGVSENFINRTFIAAGHYCSELNRKVVFSQQLNRIQLDSTEGIEPGDFINLPETSQRVEVARVAPGNVVVLRQNLIEPPAVNATVVRTPIQDVFIQGLRVPFSEYSVINIAGACGLTFSSDVERVMTRQRLTSFTMTIDPASLEITTDSEVPLNEVFKPGDLIWAPTYGASTATRIRTVSESSIKLVSLSGAIGSPVTEKAGYLQPEIINDDSIVSVNMLGKGVPDSPTWFNTAAEVQRDLLSQVGVDEVNEESFEIGALEAPALISMAIPEDFSSKSLPTVKSITDKLNKSVMSSLTLDNNLLIKYQALLANVSDDLPVIRDSDLISWSISASNGKTFKDILARYRFRDVEPRVLTPGNRFTSHSSDFVRDYIGTSKTEELDLYLYNRREAEAYAQRSLYYNRLGVTTLTLTSDLRLEYLEIGDVVVADLQRLYRRYGDEQHRKKTLMVTGKNTSGERVQLVLCDLGNTFNASAFITEDVPDFASSTPDEKMIHGYITDSQGIVDNDEDTANTNLIS